MPKKSREPHAAEAFEQAIIAGAIYFTAFCRPGVGHRVREEAPDQAAAEAAGALMAAKYACPVLIYAVNSAGRQALVTSIPAPSRQTA